METDTAEEVVTHALNVMTLLGWSLAGAVAGIGVFLVVLLILSGMGRRYWIMKAFTRRTRAPLFFALLTTGVLTGFRLADTEGESIVYKVVEHGLVLLFIGFIGWFFYSATGLLRDMTRARVKKDPRGAQRIQTQSQVLQRVIQSTVVISTVVAMALTFPAARAPLASLLGAAGILSVVAGLAAQTTLGNVFAGIQLAFTDAIRVGDTVTVTVDGSEEVGTIEELTLTYVVLRIWNERRVLLPSSYFTTQPFENWTRTGTDQLGKVELKFDWPVPMARVRLQAQRVLAESELWDHRTWNVQMTESDDHSVTVRIVLSATTPGNRWDLECEVREKMMEWVNQEIPWSLPKLRTEREETQVVNRDVSEEKIAELAENLQQIAAPPALAGDVADDEDDVADVSDDPVAAADPLHASKLRASRRKAKQARRKSILHREVTSHFEVGEPTQLMTSATAVAADMQQIKDRFQGNDVEGTRLYSGSSEADQRGQLFSGPGEHVFREREETAIMQALDSQGQLLGAHSKDEDDQAKDRKGGRK